MGSVVGHPEKTIKEFEYKLVYDLRRFIFIPYKTWGMYRPGEEGYLSEVSFPQIDGELWKIYPSLSTLKAIDAIGGKRMLDPDLTNEWLWEKILERFGLQGLEGNMRESAFITLYDKYLYEIITTKIVIGDRKRGQVVHRRGFPPGRLIAVRRRFRPARIYNLRKQLGLAAETRRVDVIRIAQEMGILDPNKESF